MVPVSRKFLPPQIEKRIYSLLISAIGKVSKKYDVVPFLSDILYPSERVMMAKRLSIAFLLLRGDYDQRHIARVLRVSTNTVARVNLILKTQGKGYRNVVEKLLREEAFRIVLNDIYEVVDPIPHKGTNWGEWKKERRKRRRKLTSF